MARTEPHVVVLRGDCPECGEREFYVIAVPKLATGELFPQVGKCDNCEWETDLVWQPPLTDVSHRQWPWSKRRTDDD